MGLSTWEFLAVTQAELPYVKKKKKKKEEEKEEKELPCAIGAAIKEKGKEEKERMKFYYRKKKVAK